MAGQSADYVVPGLAKEHLCLSRDIVIISFPLTHFQIDLLHLCLSKSFNSVRQLEYLVLLLGIHLGIAMGKLFQANKTRGGRRYFIFSGHQDMQLHKVVRL